MKNIITILLIGCILSSCSSNRYVLTDANEDKDFLKDKISEFQKTEGISNKPIIVVDGIPYRYTHELKEERLKLSKADIQEINILKREAAISIYGKYAEGGVLLITTFIDDKTKFELSNDGEDFDSMNVLFIVNNKEVDSSFIKKINPNDIETITVIKDKEEIKKYSTKEYEGVIVIVMKKI